MSAGSFSIRANLLSNREQSYGVRHRAANSVFGIYQFPDDTTKDAIFDAMAESEDEHEKLLTQAGYDFSKFVYFNDPRVTHVQTNKVKRQIAKAVAAGFDIAHMTRDIDHMPKHNETILRLGRLSWMGAGERTLAVRFVEDEIYEEVIEINHKIIERLGKMGLHGIEPKRGIKPHMSIARLGHPRDGMPPSRVLKTEIEETTINRLPSEFTFGALSIIPTSKQSDVADFELDTSEI